MELARILFKDTVERLSGWLKSISNLENEDHLTIS